MPALVGLLIVLIAAVSVGGVLFLVMQEKHEHEEQYIPGQTPEMLNTSEKPKTPEAHG